MGSIYEIVSDFKKGLFLYNREMLITERKNNILKCRFLIVNR